MFIFDVEIKHGIPPKDAAERKDDLIYCAGWTDYAAMGVACVCVWDYTTNNPRVFGEQEMEELQKFVDSHDVAIGFNNNRFDNNVLQAAGVVIQPNKSYDLLTEIFTALGSFQKGCRLDDVVKANFPNALGKSGDGAFAPELWQKGFYTRVIDYCFNDVRMTKMLIDKILRCGFIKNPIFPDKNLRIKRP